MEVPQLSKGVTEFGGFIVILDLVNEPPIKLLGNHPDSLCLLLTAFLFSRAMRIDDIDKICTIIVHTFASKAFDFELRESTTPNTGKESQKAGIIPHL